MPKGEGVAVDMISLQPAEMKAEADQEAEGRRRKTELEARAQFLSIPQSDAGKLVVAEIEAQLVKRIKELLKEDPVATHLLAVLDRLNHKTDQARRAWNALQAEHLRSWNTEANGASGSI